MQARFALIFLLASPKFDRYIPLTVLVEYVKVTIVREFLLLLFSLNILNHCEQNMTEYEVFLPSSLDKTDNERVNYFYELNVKKVLA